jgi:glutaredoxin
MPGLELYGSAQCPYTRELRDWLEWTRRKFCEYDVETDDQAYQRMQTLTGGSVSVPILVEDGKIVQVGWQGRACVVGAPAMSPANSRHLQD